MCRSSNYLPVSVSMGEQNVASINKSQRNYDFLEHHEIVLRLDYKAIIFTYSKEVKSM